LTVSVITDSVRVLDKLFESMHFSFQSLNDPFSNSDGVFLRELGVLVTNGGTPQLDAGNVGWNGDAIETGTQIRPLSMYSRIENCCGLRSYNLNAVSLPALAWWNLQPTLLQGVAVKKQV